MGARVGSIPISGNSPFFQKSIGQARVKNISVKRGGSSNRLLILLNISLHWSSPIKQLTRYLSIDTIMQKYR